MELNSEVVNIPVSVDVQLINPAGRSLSTSTPPSESGSNYTTTAMISSFGSGESGTYQCRATVSATVTSTFITPGVAYTSILVAVGEYS